MRETDRFEGPGGRIPIPDTIPTFRDRSEEIWTEIQKNGPRFKLKLYFCRFQRNSCVQDLFIQITGGCRLSAGGLHVVRKSYHANQKRFPQLQQRNLDGNLRLEIK